MTAPLPEVPGILTARGVRDTVDAIASVQLPDGNIPWTPEGHTDPWNLVEAAMALDVGGRHADAERAYEWLRGTQRTDGGWHAYYLNDQVKDPTLDTNVTCYIANGVLHHWLSTGDDLFLARYWPVVERAIDFALERQFDWGAIAWRADDPADGALLTGSSSIHASIRCALLLAEQLDQERPDWELSLGSIAHAIVHREDEFLDKGRWAMDWYYPILGGVLRDAPAFDRVDDRWATFVVGGRGLRCVSDKPWITAAETCEFVMALDAMGDRTRALELFEWVQFLRHHDGAYWTGMNFDYERFEDPGEHYTPDHPTWNSAAVVLAANALGGTGLTAGFFRYEGLAAGLDREAVLAELARLRSED